MTPGSRRKKLPEVDSSGRGCECALIEDKSRQALGVADRTSLVRIVCRRGGVRLANRVVLTGKAATERNEASQEVHQCSRPFRNEVPVRTVRRSRSGQSRQW